MPTVSPTTLTAKGNEVAMLRKMLAEDAHVKSYTPLAPADLVQCEISASPHSIATVLQGRIEAKRIVHRESDRLLVLVGPCSIHDPDDARGYAALLRELAVELQDELFIVMRAYLEKPRTVLGWKGLVNDPDIDHRHDINKGIWLARRLLADITAIGVPVACEILSTIIPQYTSDLISIGAIGARTTESQLHRELASGLSFPIGFKNATDGSIVTAINSLQSMRGQHHFVTTTKQGTVAIANTTGNSDGFVIHRGGTHGTNYHAESVNETANLLRSKGENEAVMIDCSHGNSQTDYRNQPKVLDAIEEQIRRGEESIIGVMIESNMREGSQKPSKGLHCAEKGVSITDACIDWETTEASLRSLAEAVRARRVATNQGPGPWR